MDTRGRHGCMPPGDPNSFIFMQFSAKNRLAHPLLPATGGSAWGFCIEGDGVFVQLDGVCIMGDGVCIQGDGVCIQGDGVCI